MAALVGLPLQPPQPMLGILILVINVAASRTLAKQPPDNGRLLRASALATTCQFIFLENKKCYVKLSF